MNEETKMKKRLLKEIVSLNPEEINFDDKDAVKELVLLQHNNIGFLLKLCQELREENLKLKDEISRLKGRKADLRSNRRLQRRMTFPFRENQRSGRKKAKNGASRLTEWSTEK